MKRKNAIIATFACAVALCLALVGCSSGGGSASADPEEPYVGYWTLVEGNIEGTDVVELLDQFSSLGIEESFIVHLEAGGTGEIDMFGEVEDITWDASAATMTIEGEEQSITIDENGQLKFDGGEDYLLFEKGSDDLSATIEADRQVATETGAAAGNDLDESEAISPAITVADDDVCTIAITEKGVDSWGDAGYTVEMTNNSDQEITIWIPIDVTSVDGTADELYGREILSPGASTTAFFYFEDIDTIEGLVNVQTTFTAYENETYEDIANYEVTIP